MTFGGCEKGGICGCHVYRQNSNNEWECKYCGMINKNETWCYHCKKKADEPICCECIKDLTNGIGTEDRE